MQIGKYILLTTIGIIIGALLATTYFTYNINKESTEQIDNEIKQYNNKINELDKEISKYVSGLLPLLLKLQKSIYAETVASLEQKKSQLAHWITLNYKLSSTQVMPVHKIDDIDKEINNLKLIIEKDKMESAKYSQCLIKSLIETRIAQQQFTLSGLERAKIAYKYNIPFLLLQNENLNSDKEVKPERPKQTPEEDKSAL